MKLYIFVLSIVLLIFISQVNNRVLKKAKGKFADGAKSAHHIVQRDKLLKTYEACERLNVIVSDSKNNFTDNKRDLVNGPLAETRLIDEHDGIDYEILVLMIKEKKLKTLLLGLDYFIDKKQALDDKACTSIKKIWAEINKFQENVNDSLEDTAKWSKKDDKFYVNTRLTKPKMDEKALIAAELDDTSNDAIKQLEEYKEEIAEKSVLLDNKLNDKRVAKGLAKI